MYLTFDPDYNSTTILTQKGPRVIHKQTMVMHSPEDKEARPREFESSCPEGGYDPEKVYRFTRKNFVTDDRQNLMIDPYGDVVECSKEEAHWLMNPPGIAKPKAVAS